MCLGNIYTYIDRSRKFYLPLLFGVLVLSFVGFVRSDSNAPRAVPAIAEVGGVVDGATLDPSRGIASGAWVSIFGTNLCTKTRSWEAADFVNGVAPRSLNGVSVQINGRPAFVAFTMRGIDFGLSYDQINAIAPADDMLGQAPVQVTTPEGASAPVFVSKVAQAPAFFAFEPQGRKFLAATTADGGEFIAPISLFGPRVQNKPTRATRFGEVVTLYGSGFGPAEPAAPDGAIAQGSSTLTLPLVVRIGGQRAEILYAGRAPNLTGVYQFNVRVPEVSAGEAEVTAGIGNAATPAGKFLLLADAPFPAWEHSGVSDFRLTGAHAFVNCARCHVSSRFAGTPRACAACHLPTYQSTRTPSHTTSGFPTDCAQCHTTTRFAGSAVNHSATKFPLSGAHAVLPCATCHQNGELKALDRACSSCHLARYEAAVNPNHAAAGFPRDCAVCHNTSDFHGASFDHAKTARYPLMGAHATAACASCHSTGQYKGTSANCASCHMARYEATTSPNHRASGYPADCAVCHTTTSFRGATADHNRTRFPLTGAHQALQCIRCHGSGQFAGLDFACASCHLDRYNTAASPSHAAASFPKDCAVCHATTAFKGASFSHTRFPLSGTHTRLACNSCHGSGQFAGLPNTCASCHSGRFQSTTNPNHVAARFPTDCSLCHSTTQFAGARFVHSRFQLAGAHTALACASCHSGGQYAGRPSTCVSCHLPRFTQAANPNHVTAGFPQTCETCHTTASFKGAVFNHARFALTGAHTSVACASCHSGGQYAGRPSTCVSCHLPRFTQTTNPNHVTAGFPQTCETCHTTASFKGAVFNHAKFPIYSPGQHAGKWRSCSQCHVNAANFKEFSCFGCHAKADTDSHHREVRNYVYNSANCYACHPLGRH